MLSRVSIDRWAVAIMVMSASVAPAQTAGAEDEGKRAVVGYASNIEAFSHCRVRFRTTFGVAGTEEEAKLGKGTTTRSVEAVWVADGERELLEVFGVPKPTSGTAPDGGKKKGGASYVENREFVSEKAVAAG